MRCNGRRGRMILIGIGLFGHSVLFLPRAIAQAVAVAQVDGQVMDSTGALVPGAQMKMTETEKGIAHTTTADAGGHYLLPNLPAGPYTLEASAPGFKGYLQPGIILQVGQNIQINVTLQLGAVSEHVEVTGSVGMVETRDNTISNVMDGARVLDLPLNGRQRDGSILLTAGAVTAPAGDQTGTKNYFSSVTISIAGGQSTGTNYMLDGAENTDTFSNVNLPFPFPDALQEFSVETSTLPARNGMHPGGVVNVITKSGANAFHGDLFEFIRNGDVNARNFFAATHDSLKRNQYGEPLAARSSRTNYSFSGATREHGSGKIHPRRSVTCPPPRRLPETSAHLTARGAYRARKKATNRSC